MIHAPALDRAPGRDWLATDTDQRLAVLLSRTAAGDTGAFRQLYTDTSAKLFATVCRILRERAAAEDALQEAYLRIWRRAESFDSSIASPIAWMTTVARHAAIDLVRTGASRVSAASVELNGLDELQNPGGGTAEDKLAIVRCLGELDAERRNMIVHAYCHGWSREELASRFDRPVATVKTMLRRALIALKECLGGER